MTQFPDDFTWGAATSSYQIEGAHNEDGKGPSIWDAFCTIPNRVENFENGNTAIDHYHRYKEDIALIKSQGFHAYRFSISWPRILPEGKGTVNEKGIEFYSNLIDELLAQNITPWVTLYHWDLPLALQMEHDGWLNSNMADWFADYARICFERFGDRVKHWITLNEPWVVSILGYGQGIFAPGRISNTEPYLAAHNLLLAHAKAVEVYRSEFHHQKGTIGITNNCDWREPLTKDPKDKEAAERALLFFLGWFADPVYRGDYPQVMKDRLADRLPEFTNQQKQQLQGSSDFFGLNHYATMYAAEAKNNSDLGSVYGNGGLSEDQEVELSQGKDWELTTLDWGVVPWGCRKLLEWISKRYDHPEIFITENGFAQDDIRENDVINDNNRIRYYQSYLEACHQAIDNGVKLRGYFAWSFFDNFEWATGYKERIPKASALWFKELIAKNGFDS